MGYDDQDLRMRNDKFTLFLILLPQLNNLGVMNTTATCLRTFILLALDPR